MLTFSFFLLSCEIIMSEKLIWHVVIINEVLCQFNSILLCQMIMSDYLMIFLYVNCFFFSWFLRKLYSDLEYDCLLFFVMSIVEIHGWIFYVSKSVLCFNLFYILLIVITMFILHHSIITSRFFRNDEVFAF